MRPGPGWGSCCPALARWTRRPGPSWPGRRRCSPATSGTTRGALAARQRLAPLLPGIQDPFLHAVARLAMAWTLPVAGDYGGALREAAASLEELRGQDEPVFTAMAALTVGSLETTLDRYDDALRHLGEARDLAERVRGDWLAAGSRVQLGILDVVRGSLDEARPLLEEALDRSLAARSTSFVTLCLAGYAQLAFADGDPDRARCWKARPRACAGGSACGHGRICGGSRPIWWPRSARGWAQPGSIRRSPPAPGSPSSRR